MIKTKTSEPINRFLNENRKRNPISFHMPGHKYGRFSYKRCRYKFPAFDITEIHGADNIKKPEGIIKESLINVSRIYDSASSFYLTNGTTSGIHAIIRHASQIGRRILLSRDCHISAVNGAILFGMKVAFINSGFSKGIPLPATADSVARAIKENPDACGVIITSPNYYGMTADINKIAGIVHSNGMFLAVDEAHGAHFRFSGLEKLSGIKSGADIVCHSLHKTLPVYNQGAVLHVCSDLINTGLIKQSVDMLGTTSPSYPIMASMENAVRGFNLHGKGLYDRLNRQISWLKKKLSLKTICSVIDTDDFSRIVIKTGISGFEASGILHREFGIDVESADFGGIICIATPMNKKSDFRKLYKALRTFETPHNHGIIPKPPGTPKMQIPLGEAAGMKTKTVPFEMAEGNICGTIIVSYPPGTPILCPGEIIDGYVVDYIMNIMNAGGTVLGIEDNKIPVLEQT